MQHHMDSTHTSSHMQKRAHHTCRKRDSNSHMQTSKALIRTAPT
ncbi:hypothetical protein I3843_03G168200 [Carya illinoinensis]|nr:hypothetical protein I3843_03G168200 [Carya illinoinensis]